jgi:photosystem II stability/assembly factor-like uncharacterized protein
MRPSFLFAGLIFAGCVMNSGAQWTLQDSHVGASFRGVAYVGNGVAWVSGTSGTVVHTDDMGTTWQKCATPTGAEKLDFRGVQAFDAKTAIVFSSGTGDLSRVYKTTEGCQNWTQVFTDPDPKGFFDAMFFKDKTTGYLMGDPIGGSIFVAETTDGGEHWTARHDKGLETDPSMGGIYAASNSAITISDGRLTFGSGGKGGAFIHQLDEKAGRWKSVEVPLGTKLESAGFFGIAAGGQMAVGGDYQKADDGSSAAAYREGNVWKKAVVQPHGFRSAVAFDDKAKAWITVGPNGTDISRDNGRNWQPLTPGKGDALDADRRWNSLSLPFVVGSRGRIGLLREDALKETK